MALPIAQRRARNTTLAGAPREFEDIYDQMGQLINAAFGEVSTAVPWSPTADVFETDDAYVVEAEIPGARKDQIDIQLNERELVVSGDITEREGRLRRKERRRGRFEYRVYLPGDIDPEGVRAELTEGVLTVVVPKSSTEKNRHIEITD
ncbi:MAG: heat shock protein Hsp20 [Actinoallomurus sp.]|jgi:HSP20 family protein|nr:heat shock protein Hsp20 [Actinoallomurus sp.]